MIVHSTKFQPVSIMPTDITSEQHLLLLKAHSSPANPLDRPDKLILFPSGQLLRANKSLISGLIDSMDVNTEGVPARIRYPHFGGSYTELDHQEYPCWCGFRHIELAPEAARPRAVPCHLMGMRHVWIPAYAARGRLVCLNCFNWTTEEKVIS